MLGIKCFHVLIRFRFSLSTYIIETFGFPYFVCHLQYIDGTFLTTISWTQASRTKSPLPIEVLFY